MSVANFVYSLLFCLVVWGVARYYFFPKYRRLRYAKYVGAATRLQSKTAFTSVDFDSPLNTTAKSVAQTKVARTASSRSSSNARSESNYYHTNRSDILPWRTDSANLFDVNSDDLFEGAEICDNEDSADSPRGETNLHDQLNLLREERKKSLINTPRTAVGEHTSPQYHSEPASPQISTNTTPDLRARIGILEEIVYQSSQDITMLSDELKTARVYEHRFNENDKRLAETVTLLLQKEDELLDLQNRYNTLYKQKIELQRQLADHNNVSGDNVNIKNPALVPTEQPIATIDTDTRNRNAKLDTNDQQLDSAYRKNAESRQELRQGTKKQEQNTEQPERINTHAAVQQLELNTHVQPTELSKLQQHAIHDDLKMIKGIGPVMEKTLYSLGITSFKQISEFTAADIANVSAAIDTFPDRIKRDDWVGGAREQYRKKYGESDNP